MAISNKNKKLDVGKDFLNKFEWSFNKNDQLSGLFGTADTSVKSLGVVVLNVSTCTVGGGKTIAPIKEGNDSNAWIAIVAVVIFGLVAFTIFLCVRAFVPRFSISSPI